MTDDGLPRVFDRFYRTDEARTIDGNGLGLSVVAAIVRVRKGRVTAENRAPGLAVVLRLPRRT
jgi:signal transduction histidine kinase